MPPTGRTRPDRLTSPVMARPGRTGRLVKSETSAVAIVTPADGPSLGMAPAGTCTWMSERCQKSAAIPSSLACERTQASAACTDSFITSPSCPVSVSVWVPGMRVASTKRMSPPAGVHARPVATPGTRVRSSSSSNSKRGAPRNEVTASGVIRAGSVRPSARRRATLRQTLASSRSRFRTPASRV